MAYHGVELQNSITIGKIFSIHYFEYMSNFSFAGESHNFWEFICVDKGEVGVTRGKSYTILKKGDLIFYPNSPEDGKPENILKIVKEWRRSQGLSLFKDSE